MWCYKCYGTAVCHKGVPISFDEECDLESEGLGDEIEYIEGGCLYNFGSDNTEEEKVWAAPTLWVAMKWLREVHNIHIEVRVTNHSLSSLIDVPRYYWIIFNAKEVKWMDESTAHKPMSYETVEETCEAAIKYCLENLI